MGPRQNKGLKMVNQESSLQLQRLLEMLKSKALETAIDGDTQGSNDIFFGSVAEKDSVVIDSGVSSRIQKLLEMLIDRTADGLIEWREQVRNELFSTSIGKSSFTVETRHNNVVDLLSFGMYDSKGVLVSRVTETDERYPEDIQRKIRELWTTVSARASYLISFLDQALNDLDK